MRALLLLAALAALVVAPSAGAWTWPTGGAVLQPFGFDPAHPYAAGQHRGIDVAGEPGSTVLAPAAGTVTFAGTVPTSGKSVTIETADGYAVTLTHLGSLAVARGATVAEGDGAGTVGPSGDAEVGQPYVHLGVRVASNPQGYLDPLSLLTPRDAAAPALVAVPVPAQPAAARPPAAAAPAPTGPASPAAPASSASPTRLAPAQAPVTVPAAADSAPAPPAAPATVPAPAPPSLRISAPAIDIVERHRSVATPAHAVRAAAPALASAGASPAAASVERSSRRSTQRLTQRLSRRLSQRLTHGAVRPRSVVRASAATRVKVRAAETGAGAGRTPAAGRTAHPQRSAPVAHVPPPARAAPAPAVGASRSGARRDYSAARRDHSAARRHRSGSGRLPLAALAALLALAAGLAAVGVRRRREVVRMIARSGDAAEDPRSAGLAVCVGTPAPGACGGLRCPGGRLRAVSPAQRQRRAHGQRDGRARHAGHGRRRSRGEAVRPGC